jgi:hypothetical protein
MDTLFHLQLDPLDTRSIRLPRGRTLSFEARRIVAIESLEGTLWATVDGEPKDHVLCPSETLPLRATCGRIVIEALDHDAAFRVVPRVGAVCAAPIARRQHLLGVLAQALDGAACRLHRLADRLAPRVA